MAAKVTNFLNACLKAVWQDCLKTNGLASYL